MPFAVVLYFDSQSGKTIRKVWDQINASGLTANMQEAGFRPHITLAVFDQLACQPCENALADLAAHTHLIPLQLHHLGIFSQPEPVIFVAPIPTMELLMFHQSVIETLSADGSQPRDIYQPGEWIPHCTLAIGFDPRNMPELIRLSMNLELPFDARIDQLGVVEYQPLKDIFKYDLAPD